MLAQTAHCSDQENWALLEVHPNLGLGKNTGFIWTCSPGATRSHGSSLAFVLSAERCLEDHEVVLEVQASWSLKSDTRFVFCKNYAMYEFFRKPTVSGLQRVCKP